MKLDGVRGLHGWQWIFIIEGIPTIVLAGLTFFVLPNLPENSKGKTKTIYFTQRTLIN